MLHRELRWSTLEFHTDATYCFPNPRISVIVLDKRTRRCLSVYAPSFAHPPRLPCFDCRDRPVSDTFFRLSGTAIQTPHKQ